VTLLTLPPATAESLRSSETRVLVTGAGGWIGSATLELLAQALGPEHFQRRVRAFASRNRRLDLRGGVSIDLVSLESLAAIETGPAILLHYAFLTREKASAMGVDAYGQANSSISDTVATAVARLKPQGMFLASSGAVYGPGRAFEEDLARDPYGVLKRRDETLFAEACRAAGTRLTIARVFNLSGPYINKLDSYALACFLVDALAGRPIAIRAKRLVERSYVHVGDVVALALAELLAPGSRPLTFDTAGERVVEVGELARLVTAGVGRPDLEIRRPPLDPAELADRYVGDAAAMQALARRHDIRLLDLPEQIRWTAEYVRSGGSVASEGAAAPPAAS
jgi:UDP-glucuronate decarboxylase